MSADLYTVLTNVIDTTCASQCGETFILAGERTDVPWETKRPGAYYDDLLEEPNFNLIGAIVELSVLSYETTQELIFHRIKKITDDKKELTEIKKMYREYMLEVGKVLEEQEHLSEMRADAKSHSELGNYLDALMKYFGDAFTTIFKKEEEFYQSFKLSIERGADLDEAGSLLGNGYEVTKWDKTRNHVYMGMLGLRDKMAATMGFATAEAMMPELPQMLQGANEIQQAVYSIIDTYNTAAKDEMIAHLQYFENQIGIDVEVLKFYLRQLQEWLSMAKRAIKDYYDTMIQQLSRSQV